MKVEFKRAFLKDLEKIREKSVKERILDKINKIKEARELEDIRNIKKTENW